jgi:hypothetical protein
MKIETKEVREGLHNGKVVWICHYLQPDLNKKPLRNLPPTQCIIADNSETTKRIYYSKSHFQKIGKNGNPTKTVYSPVDNTGYRSLCGNELYVFDDESECRAEWIGQVADVMARVQENIDNAANHWISEKKKLRDMI